MRSRTFASKFLFYIFMASYIAVIFYPIYLMVVTSLKPNAEIFMNPFGLPRTLHLKNYATMLQRSHYPQYFLNSLSIVMFSSLIVVCCSAPASFILAKYRFRGSGLLYSFFVAGLIIPIKLGTISILRLMIQWGINDSILSVILVNAATGIPFGVFILTDFIRLIPDELSAAGRIDGCSETSIFLRVILPLLLPALASVIIVNFIPVWNDFWFPLVLLRSDSAKTVPLATALLFGQYQTNFGYVFAVLTLASIPVVLVYLLFSSWFVKGLTEGSVKG
jgi:raffinose/stachyose/melibiose transport system permease protein